MPVDIVERLRKGITEGNQLRWQVTPIHEEAADEIATLRQQCAELQKEAQDLVGAQYAISALCQALKPFTFAGLRFDFGRWDGETKVCVRLPSARGASPETWLLVEDITRAREVFDTVTKGMGAGYDEE